MWQIFRADNVCTLLGPISLLYKQLLQYTLLKSLTIPSALLIKFPKKFHMKVLASDIIFTKLSKKKKHFSFDAAVFHLSIKSYCKTRPHRSYCLLSMFKLCCKRHYRNLATYSWCTTWREQWTRHENGAGATPTFGRRRRRADQFTTGGGGGVNEMSAAAARRRTALACRTHSLCSPHESAAHVPLKTNIICIVHLSADGPHFEFVLHAVFWLRAMFACQHPHEVYLSLQNRFAVRFPALYGQAACIRN